MKSLRFALAKIAPLMLPYVFSGMAFGLLMSQNGYSVLWSFAAGLFIYAGAMQFVMISLMVSGAPLLLVAATTFFVNARHMFYGIGFIEKFKSMGWKYPYMALTLTDETYSVLCSITYPEDVQEHKVDFYIQFLCHMTWAVSCALGGLLGEVIPFDMTGIDFSITAFFVVIVVNQWLELKSRIPVITGFISAVIFYFLLGADSFILPAICVSAVVMVAMKDYITKKNGGFSND